MPILKALNMLILKVGLKIRREKVSCPAIPTSGVLLSHDSRSESGQR